LRHIVISHHGERVKGSPVVPATREAVIVHFCDDMTARLAAIDEIAGRTAADTRWSGWVNMLDGLTYLPAAVDPAPVDAPADPAPVDLAPVDAPAGTTAAAGEPAGDEPSPGDDEPAGDEEADAPTGAALF
jgi:3'-5' exoribonuclease